MSCNITKNKNIKCCNNIKANNNVLKINELLEVSIGNVSYGKLKTLIVQNDKMEFTIEI